VKAQVKQAHLQDSTTASLDAEKLARARYESGVAPSMRESARI